MFKLAKKIVKCILPNFLISSIFFIKNVIFNKKAKKLKNLGVAKKNRKVVVLGNGPSLKNDLGKVADLKEENDFLCVNNFCQSEYYEILKPNLYVFLDGYFFSQKVHNDWVKQREKTFDTISKKTKWDMKIILPHWADDQVLKKIIKNNNIEIIKVKFKPTFMRKKTFFNYCLLKSGYFGPAQNNVLIYAVYYAIKSKYEEIVLYGADMSIYKNIDVNQKDNSLIMTFKHFNSPDKEEKLMTGPMKNHSPSMSEMMFSAYRVIKQHEILNWFAEKQKIKILNFSSYSILDCYQREDK